MKLLQRLRIAEGETKKTEEKKNYKAQSSCIFVQLGYQNLPVQKIQIMLDLHLDSIGTTVQ
jgi:hypothetical protein